MDIFYKMLGSMIQLRMLSSINHGLLWLIMKNIFHRVNEDNYFIPVIRIQNYTQLLNLFYLINEIISEQNSLVVFVKSFGYLTTY